MHVIKGDIVHNINVYLPIELVTETVEWYPDGLAKKDIGSCSGMPQENVHGILTREKFQIFHTG